MKWKKNIDIKKICNLCFVRRYVYTTFSCTPLCWSNGTFSLSMDIIAFMSDFQKYRNPAIKRYTCMWTYCRENWVCVSLLTVKITPDKHTLGSRFLDVKVTSYCSTLRALCQWCSFPRHQMLKFLPNYRVWPLFLYWAEKTWSTFFVSQFSNVFSC